MDEEAYYTRERLRMVEEQIAGRDIDDQLVLLQAMRLVPRHCFVPQENRHLAYADCPLPIGQEQTISQPYIVALMTQLLLLQGSEVVLEIGTGHGILYQPLDAWMAAEPRSVVQTLRLFGKICSAVNAAHVRGITHRDLKPGKHSR